MKICQKQGTKTDIYLDPQNLSLIQKNPEKAIWIMLNKQKKYGIDLKGV